MVAGVDVCRVAGHAGVMILLARFIKGLRVPRQVHARLYVRSSAPGSPPRMIFGRQSPSTLHAPLPPFQFNPLPPQTAKPWHAYLTHLPAHAHAPHLSVRCRQGLGRLGGQGRVAGGARKGNVFLEQLGSDRGLAGSREVCGGLALTWEK